MTTTNNLGISQDGLPIYDNASGTFTSTIPPADQVLVGDANSQIIGVDPTGFDVGNPLCTTGVGTPPNFSATPTVDKITILDPPSASTDGANKAYVDSVAAGLTFINAVRLATTANLTATYANGTGGVGATLTNSGAQAALSIDSTAAVLGNRILVKNQTAQEENGVYEVTDVGSGSTNWELERTTDYDQTSEIVPGSIVPVTSGSTNANSYWVQTETVATVGTDPIEFLPFANVPTGVLLAANNLSDVASAATSRSNLGLTAVATQNTTQYAVQVGGAGDTLVSLGLGSAGQVLTSNGAGANPSFQAVSGGSGFSQIVVQTFTSSGTYTPTPNMSYCIVEVVGGGGGSGGLAAPGTTATRYAISGSGGGGGYARKVFDSATIGASQSITIGAGGTAAAAGNNAGGAGGTTTFGSTLLQATGGAGGPGGASLTSGATQTHNAVNNGVGTLGDVNLSGCSFPSMYVGGVGIFNGQGGTSFYSLGVPPFMTATGTNQVNSAIAGVVYGGGARGANTRSTSLQAAQAGAAGSAGIVIITEFII